MSDADELAAELARLSAEYRVTLARRLDALDEIAVALSAEQAGTDSLRELRRALHSITGSAKTFGLPSVSEAARAGEALIAPWCEGRATPQAEDWAALKDLLSALRKAAKAG